MSLKHRFQRRTEWASTRMPASRRWVESGLTESGQTPKETGYVTGTVFVLLGVPIAIDR